MGTGAACARRLETATGHDIPSLDGLRAIAISIVVLSHTKSLLPAVAAQSGLFRYSIGGGLLGVQIFFVISGYLITTLLLREIDRTGSVSISRFFARRALRIFPPFYLYLVVVAILWIAGIRVQDASTFLSAATYTIIYHPNPQGWLVQHSWSLSIEEQFYLLWPVVLVIALHRGIEKRLAVSILIAMPVVRGLIAAAAMMQKEDHHRLIVNISSIDMLVAGCLLALMAKSGQWRRWFERWITGWPVFVVSVLGLLTVPYIQTKSAGTALNPFAVALGYSATAFVIGAIVEYLVRTPPSIAGRILKFSLVRHIGVISYSIYLWQQMFTSNPTRFGLATYAFIFIAAEGSFWLLERPLSRFRARNKSGYYSPATTERTSSVARVNVSGASPNASIQ